MRRSPISDGVRPVFEAHYGFAGLAFDVVRYASGLRSPPHTHEAAYLDLCLTGRIQEFWEKRSFVRGNTTLNIIPAGAPHGSHFHEETRAFQVMLPVPWLESLAPYCPLGDVPCVYQSGDPTWIAARMHREFQFRDSATPLALEGLLRELLAQMARQQSLGPDRNQPARWLRQAKDYLHAHFTESPSLDAIAAAVGVHPSHLARGFRQHHHCTIGDYVRRLRVEYASGLLTASGDSLAQIAVAAGFADQSHFSRSFKECTGLTPSEFRKMTGRATPRQT